MHAVHTVAEVRAAEGVVLARTADGELMQRAASGLARTCAQLLSLHAGGIYGSRVVLLCGTGNNGGDALFAGARLAKRGAEVLVVPTGSRMHSAGGQAVQQAGGRVLDVGEASRVIASADLVVDGIVGIGGAGPLRGDAAELAEQATVSDALVVAVDVPSGVDADTGAADDGAVWADATVTFGLMKAGLLLAPGSMHAGLLEVVDIGLTAEAGVPSITCLDANDLAGILPRPSPTDDKYSRGVTGIAAGSQKYPGAAVLAVSGALHTKAGLVRYVGDSAAEVVSAW
ncbi:MAG: NAD(P)H-hydrate epimerase, partial [Actinomycetes bacterium]